MLLILGLLVRMHLCELKYFHIFNIIPATSHSAKKCNTDEMRWDGPALWMAQCPSERCFGMKLFSCRDFWFEVQSLIFEVWYFWQKTNSPCWFGFVRQAVAKAVWYRAPPPMNFCDISIIVYYFYTFIYKSNL